MLKNIGGFKPVCERCGFTEGKRGLQECSLVSSIHLPPTPRLVYSSVLPGSMHFNRVVDQPARSYTAQPSLLQAKFQK